MRSAFVTHIVPLSTQCTLYFYINRRFSLSSHKANITMVATRDAKKVFVAQEQSEGAGARVPRYEKRGSVSVAG